MRNPIPSFVLVSAALSTTACTPCGNRSKCADDSGANGSTSSTGDTASSDEPTSTTMSSDETATPVCPVPSDGWVAPEWDANAAESLALRAQLDTLTGSATMRGAETGEVVLGEMAELIAVWDGDPSLAAVASPGYVPIVEASFEEFLTVLAAGPQDLVDDEGLWVPGPDGGIWADDSRAINEGGLEVRQLVDKGGYSAGILYAHAVRLTEGEIDAATIDAIAAAWGTNAALDPEGEQTDSAGYSYQMGFYADMAAALHIAKTFAGDPECVMEHEEAVVTFFSLWEQTMLARTVFYGNRAEGKLLTATTDTERADVLHDLAEGIAVTAGFYGFEPPSAGPLSGRAPILSAGHVQAVMDAFGVDLDDLGASTTGQLLESLPDLEAAVAAAEGVVMDVYGVDQAAIMTYAMPTPG